MAAQLAVGFKVPFTIGGFVDAQGNAAQVDATTPTLAMKQGDFNFPGVAANTIYDPATTRLVNGVWMRDPFPGNVIPSARFDPVARNVLQYDPWVAPNREGTYNAAGPSGNLLADEFAKVFLDDYNLRLDHQFSAAFKIYGSYTENRQSGFGRPINIRQDRPEYQFNLACAREFEAETFRLRNLEGVWQRVATVALPVCIAAGIPGPNENHCLSNVARGLAEESGFEFRTVADATHFLQMERPRQCAAIVDAFVTRVLSTRG